MLFKMQTRSQTKTTSNFPVQIAISSMSKLEKDAVNGLLSLRRSPRLSGSIANTIINDKEILTRSKTRMMQMST